MAAGAFEDLGWFVIDNLPGALIPKVGELALSGAGRGYDRVALVMGGHDEEVSQEIDSLDLRSKTSVRFFWKRRPTCWFAGTSQQNGGTR